MQSSIFHIHALTALHVGSGQGAGAIDLPFFRERATGFPMLPGSGIKGVWRDECRPSSGTTNAKFLALFGPEPDIERAGERFEGALSFGDALLLCLPVRSLYGTFAWVTCPYALLRYRRGWADALGDEIALGEISALAEKKILAGSAVQAGEKVILEELDLTVERDATRTEARDSLAERIALCVWPKDRKGGVEKHNGDWRALFEKRFAIVHDEVFAFLCETTLDIRARVRLNDKKVVAEGPWYEECLPAESLLWGSLTLNNKLPGSNALQWSDFAAPSTTGTLQLGGKSTVGHGRVRWLLHCADSTSGGTGGGL